MANLVVMKAKDFVAAKSFRLAAITKHPKVGLADYERRLQSMQSTIQLIQQAYLGTHERAVVVLEGWDTAGKGGVVRRLGWALDPRSFKVYPVAAPLSHERGRHYLQRFWEKLPEPGQIVVFDRSWYGRVLVERVESFATPAEWHRAYDEINDFERAARISYDLARQQTQSGNANVLLLLTAQTTYLQAVIQVVQARATRLADTAALFAALGGGWWNRTTPPPEKTLNVGTGEAKPVVDRHEGLFEIFFPPQPD